MSDNNSVQDIAVLEQQLAASQADAQAWKDKFLRTTADFQNFTRRSDKERGEWMSSAQASVLKDLLPLVDDIDRALQDLQKKEQTPDIVALAQGLTMMSTAFAKVLAKYGVQEITDVTVFNPELHEAVVLVDSPEHASGNIVQVLQKGFKMHDAVVRHTKVSVAK